MRLDRRTVLAISVVAVLGVLALLGTWYESTRTRPGPSSTATVAVDVTSGADRGPGTLREALFVAAAADGKAGISIQVPKIVLESALPPMVNPKGISITTRQPGTEIDARALQSGPVFDVAGPDSSIIGLTVRNCPGAAILLRAVRFRLASTAIESCEVGVEVADNARQVTLERNRFASNRWGVRFAGASEHSAVVANEFTENRDAGLWAVRGSPDARSGTIGVRDNIFNRDRAGIVVGNVPVLVEQNQFNGAREAAVHVVGAGAVVRTNRISGGDAMGVIVENASAAVVEGNEIERLTAYGVMVRGSSDALIRNNRVNQCGYGLAFVLNNARSPSTAVENTIIEPQFNGIDVIGDSPILRRNRVLKPRALPLHVADFQPKGGDKVVAKPFLDNNSFQARTTAMTAGDGAPAANRSRRQ